MSRRNANTTPQVNPAVVDDTPRVTPVDVVVEDVVVAPTVAEVAETPQRTAVKRVVFRQAPIPTTGQFLTKTVLGQTVTLEVDVPRELATDVADALIALESKHFTVEPI